jgi:hypothetical protein
MAVWADFVGLISPRAQGCADPVIEFEARRAAIEFCEKTLCHQRVVASLTTVSGQSQYVLLAVADDGSDVYGPGVYADSGISSAIAASEAIERLLAVKISGSPIDILPPHAAADHEEGSPTGRPTSAALVSPSAIGLYPTPNVSGLQISVRAAMRPSRVSTVLDDGIFERYADAIADGAVARICSTPNRAYTDLAAAAEARERFSAAVDSAREGTYRSHSRTSVARMRAL